MKNLLLLLFGLVATGGTLRASAVCEADFNWEQIPGTLTIHFNSTSFSSFDIISYQWNFGDGDMGDGQNPNHTYDEPGEYLVCLLITDSEGCMSDVCHEVVVEAISSNCEAGFTWEQIPGTLTIHFNNTSTSEFDIISYQWNFGDGDMGDGQNPNHTYDEAGVYLVCLIITDANGCVSDVCHEVVVEAVSSNCEADFEWEQLPGTLTIHFFSTSFSNFDIISYQWNFGDGQMGDGNDPYHTYAEPGGYLVCLIITDANGCVSDVCYQVIVEAVSDNCNAAFEWEQFDGTLEVDFYNLSTSGHDIVSYHWTFGDGGQSDDENPTHIYDEPGVYLVCLIIEDEVGCVSDVCHEVVVVNPSGECNAEFTWEQLPGTLTIQFHSTSTSNHDIISYQWNFGDGHMGDGANPHHTYQEPGVYVVCLIITDASGCVSDVCHEVVVEAGSGECNASFTWEQIPGTLTIQFHSTSTSNHDITSYQWNFGDGHMGDGANPQHTYNEPGVYLVCLIITDAAGCVSDVCHEVVVELGSGECEAEFTWEQIPGTLTIQFHSTSTSNHDIISYQWNFGDGHMGDGPHPHHSYQEPGVYLVCLIITDAAGCVSDVCHEVVVEQGSGECNAEFTWEQLPGTLTIQFHSTSTSNHDITSYQWNFGDGHMGDGANPHHTYQEPGVYVVCLIITDAAGCVSDVCHEVVVEAGPVCEAAFTFEESDNGEIFFFNNNSFGATDFTEWHWDFGDGNTSSEENPQHEYEEPGIYTVCLIMTDTTTGCEDDYCLVLMYGVEPAQFGPGDIVLKSAEAPTSLHQPDGVFSLRYTNPIQHELTLSYYLFYDANVRIELFDLNGYRLVEQWYPDQKAGSHEETLLLESLYPGMYMLVVTIGEDRVVRLVVVTE